MECSSWPHAVVAVALIAALALFIWRLPAIIRTFND
jgi:hypothetical protein